MDLTEEDTFGGVAHPVRGGERALIDTEEEDRRVTEAGAGGRGSGWCSIATAFGGTARSGMAIVARAERMTTGIGSATGTSGAIGAVTATIGSAKWLAAGRVNSEC